MKVAPVLSHFGPQFRAPATEEDRGPFFDEALQHAPADAACATGDHGDFALESQLGLGVGRRCTSVEARFQWGQGVFAPGLN